MSEPVRNSFRRLQVLDERGVRPHVAGFDAHGYWWQSGHDAELYHKMYTLARVSGLLVWYGDLPGESHLYRYAALHFFEHLEPGMTVVRTSTTCDSLLATAAKGRTAEDHFTLLLQNADSKERTVRIEGLPETSLQWIQSSAENHYQRRDLRRTPDGILEVTLPSRSIHTFYVK